jgi:hypothetical protein
MGDFFDDQFQPLLKDCKEVYNKHRIKKGDSWMYVDVNLLSQNLGMEWTEFLESKNIFEQYGELIDIINVSLMLMARIKVLKRKADETEGIDNQTK